MKKSTLPSFLACLWLLQASCYSTRPSKGGGQIGEIPLRTINTADIALPPGYRAEAVCRGLTFPAAAAFDEQGVLHVIETGYSYGEVWKEPRLLKINKDGTSAQIASGSKNGPWTGLVYHQGAFYVSEGGALEGGKILKIKQDGSVRSLVRDLPSLGDHHTDHLLIKDGYIYFGQGTATNSGVVGPDNKDFGWLPRQRNFHDIPCQDITLAGQNFVSDNVLTDQPDDKAITGAYVPYGTPTAAGQVVKGRVPCSGAVMRIPLEGGAPELVAWGFRNPYGLALSPDGKIYVTDNAYDDRGSRPVWGTGDVLWELEEGKWYGFPDYAAGIPMAGKFKVPGKDEIKPLLQKYPNDPPRPVAVLGVHASANGFAFSVNQAFGHAGSAFVAEFGDMAPGVGKVLAPVGFKVVRVDIGTGVIEDFAVNKGKKNAPASMLKRGGLERPLSVAFNPVGDALYIVDFGVLKMTERGPQPVSGTGVIWKITKSSKS
jgi:glucose/arabinose dehydrogenase